jgi:hypothetical protein
MVKRVLVIDNKIVKDYTNCAVNLGKRNIGYVLDVQEPILKEIAQEDGSVETTFRDLTEEELLPILIEDFKKNREVLVENIEVEYNGVIYQGDETSQGRMSRALNGLPDNNTISWKAKDNSTQELNKSDLKEILYLAGQEQTRIWFENKPTITQGA